MTKVVHFKKESYNVFIGRPLKWGNPYTHIADRFTLAEFIKPSRKEAIEAYRDYILNGDGKHLLDDLHELEGKTLGCWCKPKNCHGDILVDILEKRKQKELF